MRPKRRRHKKNIVQQKLNNIITLLHDKNFSLSLGAKIVLFGVIVVFVSTFFTWIKIGDNVLVTKPEAFTANAYSEYALRPAILIIISLLIILFSIVSLKKKEKLKLLSHVSFQDYWMPIILGIFLVFYGYNGIAIQRIYSFFKTDISAGNGPILCMTGAILIFIGGLTMKREYDKVKGSFASDIDDKKVEFTTTNKDNMELPF